MCRTSETRDRGEEVYSTIKQLTLTIPRREFTHLLTTLMDSLTDTESNEFKGYFRPHARDRSLWAPYERANAPFNTSMFNESYHRVLKNLWIPKGRRARLDELVHTLRTVPEIHNDDLEIEDEKGLRTGKYRLSEQYQRHRSCKEQYEGKEDKITVISKCEWKVESLTGRKNYAVRDKGKDKCDCDKQSLHCWRCLACPRRFSCTCPDSVKAGISCKHIHAVLTYASNTDDAPEEAPRFLDEVNDDIFHDHAFQPRVIIQGEEDEVINERDLDAMLDPEDVEARKEEEKKREMMAEMRGYRYLEQAKTRFEFANRETDNLEAMDSFLMSFKSAIDGLPIPRGMRGRATAPKNIPDNVRFDSPNVKTPGRKREVYGVTAPSLVPADPDEMETCYKCESDKPPSTSSDENERFPWVKCPVCFLWAHQICVPMGAICESCYSTRYEPEPES